MTTFEIRKYYQKKPKFKGLYLTNNLSNVKERAYTINDDPKKSIVTNFSLVFPLKLHIKNTLSNVKCKT